MGTLHEGIHACVYAWGIPRLPCVAWLLLLGCYGYLRFHGYLGNPHATIWMYLPSWSRWPGKRPFHERSLTPDKPEVIGIVSIGQRSHFGEFARIVMLGVHFRTRLICIPVALQSLLPYFVLPYCVVPFPHRACCCLSRVGGCLFHKLHGTHYLDLAENTSS
jgi:hypothetical protein